MSPTRVLILAVAVGCTVLLSRAPARGGKDAVDAPLLPRPEVLKILLAGNGCLGADYVFLQMLVTGTLAFLPNEYLQMYPYAVLASELDPDFIQVYRIAGTLIPSNLGNDRWVNTHEALDIIGRGLQRFPNDLKLGFLDAFTSAFFRREYKIGGEKFLKLGKVPGAMPYYTLLGLRLLAEAGDTRRAFETSLMLADAAPDEETRQLLRDRAVEVELEGILQRIDKASAQFSAREKRLPQTVAELVASGDLDTLPTDPLGGNLFLDNEGFSHSSAKWFRLRFIEGRRKVRNAQLLGAQKDFKPVINDP